MPEESGIRAKLLTALVEAFKAQDQALAVFQGGSAAFARNDRFSDIDLQVVVKDDFVPRAAEILEQTLESVSPVEARYILPQPAWHGQWQGFYRMKEAGPYLLVDAFICKESAASYLSEPELHGASIVYFDRTGRVGNERLDRVKQREAMRERALRIRTTSDMFNVFVDKEAMRGRYIDALATYHSMILNPLVETLRMIHCPDRYNFGPRYLQHDLPPEAYQRLVRLYSVSAIDDIIPLKRDAYQWLRENLDVIIDQKPGQ